ncbi:MAG: hypothetical protein QOG52_547 [Frankiaceae bacterium]|nr:hypothetical protein [Frankiaceae bacterium]
MDFIHQADAAVAALERALLDELPEQDRSSSVVYSDGVVHPPHTRLTLAGRELSAPEEFLVCFVDEVPGANWSHPCRYVTVTAAAARQDTPALWPPEMGRLPAPWRLLYRPDDVPEWQVMPTAD